MAPGPRNHQIRRAALAAALPLAALGGYALAGATDDAPPREDGFAAAGLQAPHRPAHGSGGSPVATAGGSAAAQEYELGTIPRRAELNRGKSAQR
jgi:hypothetical protein